MTKHCPRCGFDVEVEDKNGWAGLFEHISRTAASLRKRADELAAYADGMTCENVRHYSKRLNAFKALVVKWESWRDLVEGQLDKEAIVGHGQIAGKGK